MPPPIADDPTRDDRRDPGPVRKIIHVDMDAFFASVEQRDNPELRGRPVAVGGSAARGVVAAASYEARSFGVRSAMPSVTARRKCPDLIFVPPRFDVYQAVSARIRAIMAEFTDLIEPLSLDEAYLDVTTNRPGIASATEVARLIRARIRAETGLTASAGVSYCKFLAKMASDINKPDGQAVIAPGRGPDFLAALPVARFHGVGPATAARMERLGIRTGADLRDRDLAFLTAQFGKAGRWYHDIARGIDHRPVLPDRPRKSIGTEDTFAIDIADHRTAQAEVERLAARVWQQAVARNLRGRRLTLKVRYADFRQITRSRTQPAPFTARSELIGCAQSLLAPLFPTGRPIRLIGVTLAALQAGTEAVVADRQLSLW